MAQQPEKLKWKDVFPFGLSASQFGMALGFCGRVVDFVDYLRNVVGTELEFKGNASTDHGIKTEPKARALYELLTGTFVSDGGFFLTADRLLGCSPDGRIFSCVDASPPSPAADVKSDNEHKSARTLVSVRVPFRSKWKRRKEPNVTPASGPTRRVRRLLEIKSPVHSLYDGSKPNYQPFGIPLHYLCQLQGQMAIADVDECDFFVYLDGPVCQVVAWRVRRSIKFWEWASPKLLQVVEWVRDGPPAWLDRRFEFGTFDFNDIAVEPLVFPYNLTANVPIVDPRRFPFFHRYPNPYLGTPSGVSQEVIHRGLTSAVTRFLFHRRVDETQPENEKQERNKNAVMWCRLTDNVPDSALGSPTWSTVDLRRDLIFGKTLAVVCPQDFDDDGVFCRVHATGGKQGSNDCDSLYVRFYQRHFFLSLEPLEDPLETDRAAGVVCAEAPLQLV
ncbi:oligoribonuclease [Trypanosoma rangeli]|uniref:Oligoribonuclease n=1 Tax=Trypanosoma rangeli TaxID=5698 RepID=A0A3R7NNF8_TRYRA|nr:oligoribonuclease [Trypanosoma rangeli]RNF05226.1 oligoribonuclease [Trypanosoma rangeli]|eukprot:RNF05226.1 oligoribonuclease [Trypanosoma rangeli]